MKTGSNNAMGQYENKLNIKGKIKMLNCKGQKLKQSQTLKENCILSFALLFIVTHHVKASIDFWCK